MFLALPMGSAAWAEPLPTGALVQPDGSVVLDGVVIGSLDVTGVFVPLPPPVDQAVEAAEGAVDTGIAAAEAAPGAIVDAVGQTPAVQPAPPPQPPAAPAPAAPPAVATAPAPAAVTAAGPSAAVHPVPAAPPAAPAAQTAPVEAAAQPAGGKFVAPPMRNTGGPKLQALTTLTSPFDFLSPLAAAREEAASAPLASSAAEGSASFPAEVMRLGSAPNFLVSLAGGLLGLLFGAHVILRRSDWS